MTSSSVVTTEVPKIVHIAREKLEEADLPATGQNLFECLSNSDWERLSWTFRYYLCKDQEKLLIFRETKTDEECREMVAQFVLDPADFTARGINGEKVASGESTDLARLLHESGEWYGWASWDEVTKDSHPWLLEYDEEAVEYVYSLEDALRKHCMLERFMMFPPAKRQKTEDCWVKKKKQLLTQLKCELEMYAKETMGFLDTSLEAFAAVAAAAQMLYVWMEELLIDDPDCREELEAMYMAKSDMLDKMTHKVSEAIQVTRKELLADMKRLGGA